MRCGFLGCREIARSCHTESDSLVPFYSAVVRGHEKWLQLQSLGCCDVLSAMQMSCGSEGSREFGQLLGCRGINEGPRADAHLKTNIHKPRQLYEGRKGSRSKVWQAH